MNQKTVAVFGLGAMGSRIAQNLLNSGFSVVIYNRTPEKAQFLIKQGAVFATTPRIAVKQSDVVISLVTDDESSRQVWLAPETGAALELTSGKVAIEMSTLTVDWVRELNQLMTQQKVQFLDAPVVGSRPQAEAGKLISLVGGDNITLDSIKPLLSAAGISTIQHVGPIGQGMALKLAVNALFGIQIAALAELLAMLSKCGIEPSRTMQCLGELPILSMAAKGAGSLIVAQNHTPQFPIALVEKDIRYLLQTAENLSVELPSSSAALDIFRTAIKHGYCNENITGVSQLFV